MSKFEVAITLYIYFINQQINFDYYTKKWATYCGKCSSDWGDEKSKNIKQETSQLEACRIFVNFVNYVASGTNRQNDFEWNRQVDFKGESVEVNQRNTACAALCSVWAKAQKWLETFIGKN